MLKLQKSNKDQEQDKLMKAGIKYLRNLGQIIKQQYLQPEAKADDGG